MINFSGYVANKLYFACISYSSLCFMPYLGDSSLKINSRKKKMHKDRHKDSSFSWFTPQMSTKTGVGLKLQI